MRRNLTLVAGLALAVPVLTAVAPAQAQVQAAQGQAQAAANTCYVQSGGLTAGKDTVDRYVNATSPISVKPVETIAQKPFGDRAVSLSSEWVWDDDFGDQTSLTGNIVSGGVLYDVGVWTQKGTGGKVVSSDLTRIGGGWDADSLDPDNTEGNRGSTS